MVFLLLFIAIFLLGFPIWVDILLAFLIRFILKKNAFQIGFTAVLLFILIVVLNAMNSNLATKRAPAFYRETEKWGRFREIEKWGSYTTIFEKNVNDTIEQPYGDLYTLELDNPLREELKEPRTVEFITDEFGYRNEPSRLKKSSVILVGDSFTLGSGITQEEDPAHTLQKFMKPVVGSIAFPAGPEIYEKFIEDFLPHAKSDAKFYVFYFEGNDFSFPENQTATFKQPISELLFDKYEALELWKGGILSRIHKRNNIIFRKVRAASYRINRKLFKPPDPLVEYIKIGDKLVGFYQHYIYMTLSSGITTYIFNDRNVLNRVGGIFFIPTKYRVYSDVTGVKLGNNDAFEYLSNEYGNLGIPVYDLTKCLKDEADKLLPQGKYVFWRGDTHWNNHGILAAMKCVASDVGS